MFKIPIPSFDTVYENTTNPGIISKLSVLNLKLILITTFLPR